MLLVTACDFSGAADHKGTSSTPTGDETADFVFGTELAGARKAVTAEGPNARLESFACISNAAPAVPVKANELFCFGVLRPRRLCRLGGQAVGTDPRRPTNASVSVLRLRMCVESPIVDRCLAMP